MLSFVRDMFPVKREIRPSCLENESAQSTLEISGVTSYSQTVLIPPELSFLKQENRFRVLNIFLTGYQKVLLTRTSSSRLRRFNGLKV